MNKRNNDNRGFSLVEIIIVVAILSIMAGVAGYGFSLSNGKPAEECAKKLSAALSHGRTVTLGKYRNIITVKMEDDGTLTVTEDTLIKVEDDGSEVKPSSPRKSTVGAKGVAVAYQINGGDYDSHVMAGGDFIELQYNSGSGAMKPIAGTTDDYYTGFRISKAGKVWYVQLETLTGRVTASTTDTPEKPTG